MAPRQNQRQSSKARPSPEARTPLTSLPIDADRQPTLRGPRGHSLEDAVVREVQEETGARVAAVHYHSSQPWPFPASLMLGFVAEAETGEISLQDHELEDARWFTREQIAAGTPALPPPQSVSFRLIEDWYDSGARRPLSEEPGARRWETPR